MGLTFSNIIIYIIEYKNDIKKNKNDTINIPNIQTTNKRDNIQHYETKPD